MPVVGKPFDALPVESPACENIPITQGFFKMASKKDDEGYTLKLIGPGHTFERPVGEEVATKIITFVMGGADLAERSGGSGGGSNGGDDSTQTDKGSKPSSGGQFTPKQFVAQKKPGSNYERVACLAYSFAEESQSAMPTLDPRK